MAQDSVVSCMPDSVTFCNWLEGGWPHGDYFGWLAVTPVLKVMAQITRDAAWNF